LIAFSKHGWEDYCSWSGNQKMLTRINRLVYALEGDQLVIVQVGHHY
jgi:Txe/YoeB family toxin of Txe-Axe toxin-antitoxin module